MFALSPPLSPKFAVPSVTTYPEKVSGIAESAAKVFLTGKAKKTSTNANIVNLRINITLLMVYSYFYAINIPN
ncbi:MAG: hypothetical protein VX618_03800 [Thermodesulfobacteriota bacterium]|nr:hypothetical protein [Thermodesulfobacteriota bacterium]